MSIRKLLFILCILPLTVRAVELGYDGVDCTTAERQEAASRFTVLDNTGNFYRIWIDGGLPSIDKTTPECIDVDFRTGGAEGPPMPSVSREAYAMYYPPYLFVLISAYKSDSLTIVDGVARKSNFETNHVFTFEADADANFILLREEWMGVDHAGITHSGLTIYDQPEQITYQFVF